MNTYEKTIVKRAEKFATLAHLNQYRKYNGKLYITHPKAVANLIEELSDNYIAIAASWLHDVIEDTEYTKEDIINVTNEDVAKIVFELTKEKHEGNREERSKKESERLQKCSDITKTIKCIDISCNVCESVECWQENRDIMKWKGTDLSFLFQYAKEKQKQLEYLKDSDFLAWEIARVNVETAIEYFNSESER